MKWISLDIVARCRGIDKTQIKRCVVCDQYRSIATGSTYFGPNFPKGLSQGFLFGYCAP